MSNPNQQPPGSYPPGAFPPGTYPHGSYPPGSYPPGAFPPGAFPPGAFPPGAYAYPPGSFPVPPGQPTPPSGGVVYYAAYYGPVGGPAPPPGSFPPPGAPGAPGFPYPPGSYPGYPPQQHLPSQPPVVSPPPQVPHPIPAPTPAPTHSTPPPPASPGIGPHKFVTFRTGRFIISGDNKGTGVSQKPVEIQVGTSGDIPVPANYFGDGIRLAVFRPHEGKWLIKGPGLSDWEHSAGNVILSCGSSGDIPVPGDYFGEGKDRVAVWRPSTGHWYIKAAGTLDWAAPGTTNYTLQHGCSGDIPVPFDYFGDKTTRLGIFRPSNGRWYIKGPGIADWGKSSGNIEVQHGCKDDIPVPFDYFREGRARLAVFRRSDAKWYIKGPGWADWSSSQSNVTLQHGSYQDTPLAGDFFGDGPRIAVFRPSEGQWHVKGAGFADWSNSLGNNSVAWGKAGDIPLALKLNL
eukprot:TRINITY_DN1605_c0_g1_i2.p1 TRINITY_DN1605_c0_g1~~TRINITY_DN1605_c0_g1_i2.p1  ORF type:complete len:459 (+),score=110.87 TRINITY_DN1605_c0_g1_i2:112-1488(+)